MVCGGHGRFVSVAACLAVSRYLATAGLFDIFGNSAAWHTRAKEYSAQAVKPDVCRCAEIRKKHLSSTTVSALSFFHFLDTTKLHCLELCFSCAAHADPQLIDRAHIADCYDNCNQILKDVPAEALSSETKCCELFCARTLLPRAPSHRGTLS